MVRIFVNHVDTYTGKVLSKVGCRKKKVKPMMWNCMLTYTRCINPISSHAPKIYPARRFLPAKCMSVLKLQLEYLTKSHIHTRFSASQWWVPHSKRPSLMRMLTPNPWQHSSRTLRQPTNMRLLELCKMTRLRNQSGWLKLWRYGR